MAAPILVTKASHSWDNWYLVVSRKRADGTRGKRIFALDRLNRSLDISFGKRGFEIILPKWM